MQANHQPPSKSEGATEQNAVGMRDNGNRMDSARVRHSHGGSVGAQRPSFAGTSRIGPGFRGAWIGHHLTKEIDREPVRRVLF